MTRTGDTPDGSPATTTLATSPASAIEQAAALEESDWEAAIDLLVATNRSTRSDEVEMALAALRHRCFDRLLDRDDPGTPAPPREAPALGESFLPEMALDELHAGAVRAAILEHGSLLVRGAVDPEGLRALTEGIDRSAEARHAYGKLRGRPKDAPRSAWWDPLPLDPDAATSLGRTWVRDAGGVLLADSPRMMFELLDRYEALGLRSVVGDYLGGRPVLSANKCTLRRVTTDTKGSWHQDGAFLGPGIRALNLWLSLSPCGVDAPGLDLVPNRFEHIVETGTAGSYFEWAAGDEVVGEATGAVGVVRPRFDAGDLLIFDDLFLHRTAVEPEMTEDRYAVELWSFAADAYPSGQVPLVW